MIIFFRPEDDTHQNYQFYALGTLHKISFSATNQQHQPVFSSQNQNHLLHLPSIVRFTQRAKV